MNSKEVLAGAFPDTVAVATAARQRHGLKRGHTASTWLPDILARAPVKVRAGDILYAQRKTGEVWLEGSGQFPVVIHDGEKFLGLEPSPALDVARASEHVTLWLKRGDLFLEIERFEAIVQVHAGYNNGSKTTLRFAFDSTDATARAVRRLEARYTGDFLRVTTELPGRGPWSESFPSTPTGRPSTRRPSSRGRRS